jgi:hypothetical protein
MNKYLIKFILISGVFDITVLFKRITGLVL